jgi:hypothetical protein
MKNTLLAITLLLAVLGTGCKKDKDKTEEEATQDFDGTLMGKWEVIQCPWQWGFNIGGNDMVAGSNRVVFYDHQKAMAYKTDFNPTYNPLTNFEWYFEDDTLVFYRAGMRDKVITTQNDKSEMKFIYDGQPVHIKKISNMQCPEITSIDGGGSSSQKLKITGNTEFTQSTDFTTNMTLDKYSPSTGECTFKVSSVNQNGNYLTYKRDGCPIITFKCDAGVWKKQ